MLVASDMWSIRLSDQGSLTGELHLHVLYSFLIWWCEGWGAIDCRWLVQHCPPSRLVHSPTPVPWVKVTKTRGGVRGRGRAKAFTGHFSKVSLFLKNILVCEKIFTFLGNLIMFWSETCTGEWVTRQCKQYKTLGLNVVPLAHDMLKKWFSLPRHWFPFVLMFSTPRALMYAQFVANFSMS